MPATASTSNSLIHALVTQLAICNRVVHINTEDISHEESLRHQQPAGNSLNWVVGHIVASRSRVLRNLGATPVLDDETSAQYRRGSDGNVPNPLPLSELIVAHDRTQPLLAEALQKLTDEQLAAKSPFPSPAGPDATFGEALASLVFHESYHVGQLGLLRRLLGKEGAIK